MTELTKELFEKAKNLYREIVTLEEDVDQLAEDYTLIKKIMNQA